MNYQVWALLNTVVCGAIMVVCICRLSVMHTGIRKLVRLKYTLLLSGACAYGFQPFIFGTWPTPAGMWFALTVFVGLMCSAHRWRRHPPEETYSRPKRRTAAQHPCCKPQSEIVPQR